MGTKAKLSTKALSLFLAVLMAAGCFSIALPNLAPTAYAAAEDEIEALETALIVAYDGGYLSTSDYSLTVDENYCINVVDTSPNGYLYSIIKAVGDVCAAIGTSEGTDHTKLIYDYIAERVELNQYQAQFIKEILLYDVDGADFVYGYYKNADDEATPFEPAGAEALAASAEYTVTATRTAVAAVLTECRDIRTFEGLVKTSYTLNIRADKFVASVDGDDTAKAVYYVNSEITSEESGEQDVSAQTDAIMALINYVESEPFASAYAAWLHDKAAIYNEDAEVLGARQAEYEALQNAVNATCDDDLIDAYIGVDNLNSYHSFAKQSTKANVTAQYRQYVDWIKGENIEGYYNKNDFSDTDYRRIDALIRQANQFYELLTTSNGVEDNLEAAYGYDKNSYPDYIAEMKNKRERYDLTILKEAVTNITSNGSQLKDEQKPEDGLTDGSYYRFPDNSPWSVEPRPVAAGTLPDANTTYYVFNGTSYSAVDRKFLQSVNTLYENTGFEFYRTDNMKALDGVTYYLKDAEDNYIPKSIITPEYLAGLYEAVYTEATDAEPVEGTAYYTFADGVYTAVEITEFEEGVTYYVFTGNYTLTADTSVIAGKTYYSKSVSGYTVIEDPESDPENPTYLKVDLYSYSPLSGSDMMFFDASVLYEKRDSYILTGDTSADADKTYFIKDTSYSAYDGESLSAYLEGRPISTLYEMDEEQNYIPTADAAPIAGKTYYSKKDSYTSVLGKNLVDISTCFTIPGISLVCVGNGSYDSLAYIDAGHVSPITTADLLKTKNFLVEALEKIDAAKLENKIAVFNQDKSATNLDSTANTFISELRIFIDTLTNEIGYRGYTDNIGFMSAYSRLMEFYTTDIAIVPTEELIPGSESSPNFRYNYEQALANFNAKMAQVEHDEVFFNTFSYIAGLVENLAFPLIEAEILVRVYEDFNYLYTTANYSSNNSSPTVSAANFSLLKAGIDRTDFKSSQYVRVNYLTQNLTLYPDARYTETNEMLNLMGVEKTAQSMLGLIRFMMSKINELKTACNSYIENNRWKLATFGFRADTVTYNETTGAVGSGLNTGIYAVRKGRSSDLTRTPDDTYVVYRTRSNATSNNDNGEQNLTDIVAKLDKFLTSKDFVSLIGADLGTGVSSLSEYLEDTLQQLLFNGEMISNIVTMVFPAIENLVEETLVGKLMTLEINNNEVVGPPIDQNALMRVKLGKILDGMSFSLAGSDFRLKDVTDNHDTCGLDVYANGATTNIRKSFVGNDNIITVTTPTFADAFRQIGVKVWPSTFANYLRNEVTNGSAKYSRLISCLEEAVNWTATNGRKNTWKVFDDRGNRNDKVDVEDLQKQGIYWPLQVKGNGWDWATELGKAENEVTQFDMFVGIMSDLLGAAEKVLKTIFNDFTLDTGWVNDFLVGKVINVDVQLQRKTWISQDWLYFTQIGLNEANTCVKADIKIDGFDGYNRIWVPLMEALGEYGLSGGNGVSLDTPISPSLGTAGAGCSSYELVNGLVLPIYGLIKRLSSAPLATVLDILPNLAYNIAYGGIEPLLDKLELGLSIDLDVYDLYFGHATLGYFDILPVDGLLNIFKTQLADALEGVLEGEISKALGSSLNIYSFIEGMIPFDLSDLNAILNSLLGGVLNGAVLPPINTAKLGGMGTRQEIPTSRNNGNGYSGLNKVFNDQDVQQKNKAYRVSANTADVFYSLLKYVFDFATSNDVLPLLSSFITGDMFSAVKNLLAQDNANEMIAALVELFAPKTYKMKGYEWYDGNAGDYGLNASSFVYLRYANDWTREKAEYVYDNIDEVLDAVLNMLGVTESSLSDMLSDLINGLFTNANVKNILDLFIKISAKLDNKNKNIARLLKNTLNVGGKGVDLNAWYNHFGYLYPEYRLLPEDETIELTDEQKTEYGCDAIYRQYVVYRELSGEYCIGYVERKNNAEGDLILSNKVRTSNYLAITFVRTYPLAPAGFNGWTVETDSQGNKTYKLATSPSPNNVGATGSVRCSFVHYYMFDEGKRFSTYNEATAFLNPDEKYDMTPSAHVYYNNTTYTGWSQGINWSRAVNPFPNIAVSVDSKYNEATQTNDAYYVWTYTASDNNGIGFGIGNGHPYTLVDGSTGTGFYNYDPTMNTFSQSDDYTPKASSVFTGVISSLAAPIMPILNILLMGDDIQFFDANKGIDGAAPDYTLTIKGYDTYNGSIIPLFEALGITGLMNSEQYKTAYADKPEEGFYYLVNSIFAYVDELLADDGEQMLIQKVLNLLPRLLYFIQSNGLTTFVHNLLMPIFVLVDDIRPIADVDLDDIIHQLLCKVLKLNYDKIAYGHTPVADLIMSLLGGSFQFIPYNSHQAAKDKAMVDAVYELSVGELTFTAVLSVLQMFTTVNFAPLQYMMEGMCVGYNYNGVTYGVIPIEDSAHYDITKYNNTLIKDYTLNKTLKIYGPDIITLLLSAILDVLRYEGNAEALDNFIGLTAKFASGEYQDPSITASGLLTALETVFLPRGELEYQIPNWDYLLEGKMVKIRGNGQLVAWDNGEHNKLNDVIDFDAYHSINNLDAYRRPDNKALTSWTRDSALAVEQLLSTALDFVTATFLDKETENVTFGSFVEGKLAELLTGDLLKQLAGYMGMLFNMLPMEVVAAVDEILGTHITSWANGGEVDGYETIAYVVQMANEEGNLEWVANPDHPFWKADGSDYVDSVDEFLDAVALMLIPVSRVLGMIFLEDSYKLFYTAGNNLNGDEEGQADDTDAIVLDGLGAYKTVLVPLFEALGMRAADSNGEQVLKSSSEFEIRDIQGKLIGYDNTAFIDYFVNDMLGGFVDMVLSDPVNWLLNTLPGLIYFINANGITTAVKNLFITVDDVIKTVNTLLSSSERITIGNLAGISLENLSIAGILELVESLTTEKDSDGNFKSTGLHVRKDLIEYMTTLYVGEVYSFPSAGIGGTGFSMRYTTSEDRADMLTIILALLIEIIEDRGTDVIKFNNYKTTEYDNPAVLDRLLGTDGLVGQIIDIIANPSGSVNYKDVNWFYFDEEFNLADQNDQIVVDATTGEVIKAEIPDDEGGTREVLLPGYAFQYLNYRTLWTYEKASTLSVGLEDLIVNIVNMITGKNITAVGDLLTGVGDTIDDALTGDLLQTILGKVEELIFPEGGLNIGEINISSDLIAIVGNLLSTPLEQWDHTYRFASKSDIEAIENVESLPLDRSTGLRYTTVLERNSKGEENEIKSYIVQGHDDFVKGLAKFIQPASRLLGWLLFDDAITFFVGNTDATKDDYLIQLGGSDGYSRGLVLLLEALGCKGLKTKEAYLTDTNNYDSTAFITDLAASLTNRIEEILTDPVNEVVGLIPELIYFINAGGLQVSVKNLLAGPLALVSQIMEIINGENGEGTPLEETVNDTVNGLVNNALAGVFDCEADQVGFDLDNVNLKLIFHILELFTGLDLQGPAGNRLEYFRIGGIYRYTSVGSARVAYRMAFSDEEDFADFITILLSFVVDAVTYEGNKAALAELIGRFVSGANQEKILAAIDAALDLINNGFSTEVYDIDWFYFDPENTIYDEDGNRRANEITKDTKFTLPTRTINYLTYMSNWTEDVADYLYEALQDGSLVETILGMVGEVNLVDGVSLGDLLKGNTKLADFGLFKPDLLNSLSGMLSGFDIAEWITTLLKVVLDVDLSGLSAGYVFANEDAFTEQGLDLEGLEVNADGLKYAVLNKLELETETYIDDEGNEQTRIKQVPDLDEEGIQKTDEEGNLLFKDTDVKVPVLDDEGNIVTYTAYLINDEDSFIGGLCMILKPLYIVLDWLLFGDHTSLQFFDKIGYQTDENGNILYVDGKPVPDEDTYEVLLQLNGANGYKYGLVPILEALGVNAPASAGKTSTEMLPAVLKAIVNRVDEMLEDPINEVLGLIPNLLYFINANGLSASVRNLLGAPLALLDVVNSVLDSPIDINQLIGSLLKNLTGDSEAELSLNLNNIDLEAIIGLIEAIIPGLAIFTENGGFVDKYKIENFYFGKIEWFDSASGRAAFRMSYTDDENAIDMLTVIVNFAVELILHKNEEMGIDNAAAIDSLINSDSFSIKDIVTVIEHLRDDAIPGDYHWNYFNEDSDNHVIEEDLYGRSEYFKAPETPFKNYLTYNSDWTEATANDLYDNLPALVDTIIAMTQGSDGAQTLADLLKGSLDIYNAGTLNSLTGMIKNLINGENGATISLILDVIGLVLGTDLSIWKDLTFGDDIVDRDTFVGGLTEFLAPAYPLLDWLLFGGTLGLFVKDADGNLNPDGTMGDNQLIAIKGAEGYAYGLVPLLETLGVKLPAYTVGSGDKCAEMMTGILTAVFTRVDEILADPVREALKLLPNLLYFINANGLSTAVQNLLGSVVNAANELVKMGILKVNGEDGEPLDDATIFDFIENLLKDNGIALNIGNLDLEGIFRLVEGLDFLKGLTINGTFTRDFDGDGVEENILEKFYIGRYATRYATSVSYKVEKEDEEGNIETEIRPYYAYRIVGDQTEGEGGEVTYEEIRGELLTILLSLVLEVILYEDNEQPLADILSGIDALKDKDTLAMVQAIKAVLAGEVLQGQGGEFDWGYFARNNDKFEDGFITTLLESGDQYVVVLDELLADRTKHYLEYDNKWNRELADALLMDIDGLVNEILGLIPSIEANSLSELIRDNVDLFTQENAQKIVDLVGGLLGSIDGQMLEAVGALIGAEGISRIGETDVSYVHDAETFADALTEMLRPADRLLRWLLFGDSFEYFNYIKDGETIMLTLKGGEGYASGLAPILYALGIETDLSGVPEGEEVSAVIHNAIRRVDALLNSETPIDEVMQLLPRLIYFINANGLSASLMNLVAPIEGIANEVGGALSEGFDIYAFINNALSGIDALSGLDIDVRHLDFNLVFAIVEKLAGIKLSETEGENVGEPIGKYLTTFYFGQVKHEKINDFDEFTMVYSNEEGKVDMFTILISLVLDVFTYPGNKDFLVGLLDGLVEGKGEELYYIIIGYLTATDYEFSIKMSDYNWILTDYDINIEPKTGNAGKVVSPISNPMGESNYGDRLYGPLYTEEMGAYITKYFTLFINTYITLLGIDNGKGGTYRSLDEIISGLVDISIYKKSLLETIANAVSGAVGGLKETLGEDMFNQIVEILNAALETDLNKLLDPDIPDFPDGDRDAFVNALSDMLSPAASILRWLLTAEDIALFNTAEGEDYIKLRGAEGYQYAIIPILEGLRVPASSIYTQEQYNELTKDDDVAVLKLILNPILDRLDAILENPIDEIFQQLPALVYFINSYGLDSAVKNLLNAVFELLNAAKPLLKDSVPDLYDDDGNPTLYKLIGLDLSELTFDSIVDMLLGLIPSTDEGDSIELGDLLENAVVELTLGYVRSFESKRKVDPDSLNAKPGAVTNDYAKDYTMDYAGKDPGTGSQADMATMVMRIVLDLISKPGNVKAIEGLLKGKLNDEGYKFLCSLLENFSQMAGTPDGMDKIMYTVYYIFYAALCAGVATNNGLANFNYNYSFLNQLFATSDLAFMRQLEISFGDLLNKWSGDVVDDDEVVPNGFIKFFQQIINFFKKISIFFKNLFNR